MNLAVKCCRGLWASNRNGVFMGEASNPVEVKSKQWWTRQPLTKAEEGGASREGERESEKKNSGARDKNRRFCGKG